MATRLQSMCYVLRSFPEPSETFIAEEAVSVMRRGVRVSIVAMADGNRSVIHPSSQRLLDSGCVHYAGQPGRWALARSLARLLVRQPLTTCSAFARALRHPHRWLCLRMLPAAAWCLSRDVDYLHAHFADFNLQAAKALADWLGRPYGVTTHRYDITDDPIDPRTASELLRASSLLVTISRWNVEHMVEKYRLPPERLQIVHCGIDLALFNFQERQHTSRTTLRLLQVGRLVKEKDQATLLRAIAEARLLGVDCRLELIGSGPLEAELRQLCDQIGVSDLVAFHGAQPQATVRDYLRTADVFVLSSVVEALPVACIEAAAMGLPVIATRIYGLPELIDDGVSGILVEPSNPDALARSIAWAAANREVLPAMALAARQKVEAEFDRTKCTDRLLALAEGAIGAG